MCLSQWDLFVDLGISGLCVTCYIVTNLMHVILTLLSFRVHWDYLEITQRFLIVCFVAHQGYPENSVLQKPYMGFEACPDPHTVLLKNRILEGFPL